ncbi:MAG: CD225/dispanin family protein [Planctomycetaceae bacterium]|jgi:hypothetical protein|nr:CD225/dispanin family protein [Planctomycetaceae bacterium]
MANGYSTYGYCTHCGTALVAERVACPHCGGGRSLVRHVTYVLPPRIPDYLVWSIITLCCCNLPLGIVALVFSIMCRSDICAGRYDLAVSKSNVAFWCNFISLVLPFLFFFLFLTWGLILSFLGQL